MKKTKNYGKIKVRKIMNNILELQSLDEGFNRQLEVNINWELLENCYQMLKSALENSEK